MNVNTGQSAFLILDWRFTPSSWMLNKLKCANDWNGKDLCLATIPPLYKEEGDEGF